MSNRLPESMYEFVLTKLDDLRPREKWETVATSTGMSLSTIKKIARREVKNPGVMHIELLANYFRPTRFRVCSAEMLDRINPTPRHSPSA